ncbi:protein DMR6-LIKE OXYGENASE 1-like [Dioscorea cayenensis subsp. rotundata]|uniref:Protein DMR6-LIKE OXYGENASE 1-like n=1 Tax=Dioscorea cayennensis subsp. rotundata TaxID=55577 RepID=A0AB40CYT2_DIOCR|nr:protein DMR6-LIKE OXYGENASE 1-like [Dioscorea cayenensis subsp. rotundata]
MEAQASLPLPNHTIKELSKSQAFTSSIPSYYHALRNPDEELRPEDFTDEEIPVIDFSLLVGGTAMERAEVIHHLCMACSEWGFFMVVNHGIPKRLMDETLDAFENFFNQNEEDKNEYLGKHVLDPIRFGTSFNTSVDKTRYWRDYLKVFVNPEFHSPAKPSGFRNILFEYAAYTREIGKELLKAIWESLELKTEDIEVALDFSSCFQIIVGNLYPPCPQPELALGIPAHSDHGLLTILLQNGINGLQVKHKGKWLHVKPLPNSFLVNTGDHMEIVSNGRYKSVLHRAEVNEKSTRMSIVSLIGPSLEAIVAPAPQLVDLDHHLSFNAMRYKDFMQQQQANPLKEKSILDLLRVRDD